MTTWPGAAAMKPLTDTELNESHTLEQWTSASHELSALMAQEITHTNEWINQNVRDHRPSRWRELVTSFLESLVIGQPVFSCDRLLDQVPQDYRESIINVFLEPPALSRQEFDAMKRSNVLHESLANAVRSQLTGLVNYEWTVKK